MKRIIHFLTFVVSMSLTYSLYGQGTMQLTLKYNTVTSQYEVWAKPSFTANLPWGPAQISIVLPASMPDNALTLISDAAGTWGDNSRIYAPSADPIHDFHGCSTNGAFVNHTANTETLIFRFSLSGGCVSGVRLFENTSDPDSSQPGMGGGDFLNYIPNGATSNDIYSNNYNNSGISCGSTVDTDGDGVIDSTDLDDDNDGILDTVEESACNPSNLICDTDGDGVINSLDLDSDNDGNNDVSEGGLVDINGDGKADGTIGINGAISNAIANLSSIPDKDNDGKRDPYDALNGSVPDGISTGISSNLINPNTGIIICSTNCDPDGDGILTPVDGLSSIWGDSKDSDGDGISDTVDLDDDNDGILDSVEANACNPSTLTCDTDNDGIPNVLDLDSDGDGIKDVVESGGIDGDNDGKPGTGNPTVDSNGVPVLVSGGLTPIDTDNDGKKNPYDLDSDGDGIPDAVEGVVDTDSDGKPNYIDTDSDGDGLTDAIEGVVDTDSDGKPNYLDTDSDGDGFADGVDACPIVVGVAPNGCPLDSDGDGISDTVDLDDDNDGILDSVEANACNPSTLTCDTDNDGIPNVLDLDSDGDGIKDVVESGGIDGDNDGKPGTGNPTVDSNGVPVLVSGGLTPIDTDNDGKKNPYDLDSDGDGIPDAVEGVVDTDSDGKPNYIDTDSDGDGLTDAIEGVVDTDSDGKPNYLDTDSDGDGFTDGVDACPIVVGVAPNGCPLQNLKINAKVYLQGAYDVNSGLMRDDLRTKGYLPTTQPYSAMARSSYHTGTETTTNTVFATTGTNAIVDWVLLELRSGTAAATRIATRAALLQRDGDIVDVDGFSPVAFTGVVSGNYYVVVSHRNHLGVMTEAKVALNSTATTVDFTGVYDGYGTNAQKAIGNLNALWAGNANHTGTTHRNIIYSGTNNDPDAVKNNVLTNSTNSAQNFSFVPMGYYIGDTNLDGDVKYQGPANDVDLLIFFNVFTHPANLSSSPLFIISEQH